LFEQCEPARDHQQLEQGGPSAGRERLNRLGADPDGRDHSRVAERPRVAAGRHAEHAPVLAAELRGAVVADREADAGDVARLSEEPCPCFAQADLLLELDRRHRGHRAEVAVERRDTHRRQRREFLDAQRLVVVAADSVDRAGQVREQAVGQPDLPHGRPLRAGEEPPQDLALDAGRQRGGVSGRVEQCEQPAGRVEQRS